MNAQAHLTPIRRKREFLDWWISDTHLGYCDKMIQDETFV
jgi:hypothetical protein